jgi:hypothetical protein
VLLRTGEPSMTDTTTTRRPRKMAREANADTPGVSPPETLNQPCASDTPSTAAAQQTKASQVLAMLQRINGRHSAILSQQLAGFRTRRVPRSPVCAKRATP